MSCFHLKRCSISYNALNEVLGIRTKPRLYSSSSRKQREHLASYAHVLGNSTIYM